MTTYANMTAVKCSSYGDDKDFAEWKADVNKICEQNFGLAADDLPDASWADYFHDDMTPHDAVDTAVIDAWDDIPEIQEIWYG